MNKDKPNIDRQELYRLVWSEPISKLASSFNVSGSYLARMCRELDVPTPPRGYWAQLKTKKMPKMAALPARKPEHLLSGSGRLPHLFLQIFARYLLNPEMVFQSQEKKLLHMGCLRMRRTSSPNPRHRILRYFSAHGTGSLSTYLPLRKASVKRSPSPSGFFHVSKITATE